MATVIVNKNIKGTFSIPVVIRETNVGKMNVCEFESVQTHYGASPKHLKKDIEQIIEKYTGKWMPTFYRGRRFHKDCNLTEYDKYDYVIVIKIKPTFVEWTVLSFDFNK